MDRPIEPSQSVIPNYKTARLALQTEIQKISAAICINLHQWSEHFFCDDCHHSFLL